MKNIQLKKIIIAVGALATIIIVALVFSFCTKQADTEKTEPHQHSNVRKALSPPILISGYEVILRIACTMKNGI